MKSCAPRLSAQARSTTLRSSRAFPIQAVPLQALDVLRRDGERPVGTKLANEVLDQQRDVLGAIAQRRHQHPDHRHAVVEILAKLLGGDLGAQVPVGRREHPHRGGRVAGAADRPDALLVDRAQQRRLHRRRQLADLVEEQRAAVRLLEGAAPIGHRAGERAADVAEQRRLDLLVGDGAAVEDDEGAVLARAVAVNLLGEQLLAGSRSPPR